MFHLIIHKDKFEVSEYVRKQLKQAVTDAGRPLRATVDLITPESRNLRKYVMGCLVPLLVYLDGNDYRSSKICDYYFEYYKKEFTPEVLKINGKIETFGKSSKGSKALGLFCEKLQDYLHDQHGIYHDSKAVNPEEYKKFRDEIFPFDTSYEDWIDYCIKCGFIRKNI